MVKLFKTLSVVVLVAFVSSAVLSVFPGVHLFLKFDSPLLCTFYGLLGFCMLQWFAKVLQYMEKITTELSAVSNQMNGTQTQPEDEKAKEADTPAPIDRSGATIHCPKCGQEMPSNRYVCRNCGTMID